AETNEMMGVFSEKGVPSTVKAHYVAAGGSQGIVIAEADDLEEAYRNVPELLGVDRVRHRALPDDRAGRTPHRGVHQLI
ncbi:MAG: hypothetical protein ACTHQQ_03035, partial [Solirubrobacteraceae bacterium]